MSTNAGAAAGSSPAPSTGATERNERPSHHSGRGGRGRFNRSGRGHDRARNHEATQRTATKSFVGEEKDLGDDVYEYTDGNAACDQYTKTTEKIERFVTVKYGREVGRSIADEVLFVIEAPAPRQIPRTK